MAEYIDRDVALDALDKACDRLCPYPKKQRTIMCGCCAMGDAICIIEGLAAVDVRENKSGSWMTEEPLIRTYGIPRACCSRCGGFALYEFVNVGSFKEELSNCCPHCGADMRGNDG